MNDGYPDHPEPEPDDLTRAQLAEYDPMWSAVADTLDEWMIRMHGIMSSHHNAGLFLELLALQGYRVERMEPPTPVEQLLPAPTE